jgi:hypothetical protein
LPPFIPGVEKREREREELQVGEMDLLERNIKTETEETRKEQERKEEEEVEAGERKTQEPPQQGQGLSLSLANGSGRYLASPLRDSPHRTAPHRRVQRGLCFPGVVRGCLIPRLVAWWGKFGFHLSFVSPALSPLSCSRWLTRFSTCHPSFSR